MRLPLRRVLAEERFDALHLHEPMTPAICVAALSSAQCPAVVSDIPGHAAAPQLDSRPAQASAGRRRKAAPCESGRIARKCRSSNVAISVVPRREARATSEPSVKLMPRSS